MTELKITPDKVKQAAAKCKQAEAVLKELFPEVFEEEGDSVDCSMENIEVSLFNSTALISEKRTGRSLIGIANGIAPRGLEDKCFFLHTQFDWTIKKNDGYYILIPTRL